MKITNLAICFYGQYRTGDICVPHLKSIVDKIDVDNIDIFCSVKTSNSYHTGSVSDITTLHGDDIDHIENFLKHQLKPIEINFISDPEYLGEDNGDNFVNSKYLLVNTSIIDVLLMKQQYEAEYNIFYDAVLLLRYDLVIRPADYIAKLIKQINESNDLQIWPNDPDSLIAPKLNSNLWAFAFTQMPDTINDLLLIFTGSGADRLCYELIELTNSIAPIYDPACNVEYRRYTEFLNLHVILTKLSSYISLPYIDTPGIETPMPLDGEDSGLIYNFKNKINNTPEIEARLVTVRPDSRVLGLDPNIKEDFDVIIDIWLSTNN